MQWWRIQIEYMYTWNDCQPGNIHKYVFEEWHKRLNSERHGVGQSVSGRWSEGDCGGDGNNYGV